MTELRQHAAATEDSPMLFMVIERFRDDDMVSVYQQVRDGGPRLPEGLEDIDSWVEPNFSRCFQLMECVDLGRRRRSPGHADVSALSASRATDA